MLECVINISEGTDVELVELIAATAADQLLDIHTDAFHNRSVLTLAGHNVQAAARSVAQAAVKDLDLRGHSGVHPRIGVIDVVPFVPLSGSSFADAINARNSFATWAADALHLPCFLYGPERSLPEVRRGAFKSLSPDYGPAVPDPHTGGTAVGAREILIAYNVYVECDLEEAKRMAVLLRSKSVRVLALPVGDEVQLSANLISPAQTGPLDYYQAVSALVKVSRAELVGLIPRSILNAIDERQWGILDLDPTKTIEYRLENRPLYS